MRIRFLLQSSLLVCLAFVGSGTLWSQSDQLAVGRFVYVPANSAIPQKAPCVDEAGEITALTNIIAKSSSFGGVAAGGSIPYSSRPDTIFLCRGDRFTIDYDESTGNVLGDPDPSTPPGIAYGIYACDPSVSGPTIDNILTDPCRLSGGAPPFNESDSIVYIVPVNYDAFDYNIRLDNSAGGQDIPSFFLGPDGRPTPTLVTLAATTVDGLSPPNGNGRRFPIFEGQDTSVNPTGTPGCVNVNTTPSQLTRVAYLNEIIVESDLGPDNCSGTLIVSGGVTEFRNDPSYIVTLTNTATNAVTTLDNASTYLSGDTISYTVATAGTYEIRVSDNISCDFPRITVSMTSCPSTAPLTVTADPTPVSCAGSTDGSITVTASGGTAPYNVTYQRTTPATPPVSGSGNITTDGGNTVLSGLAGGIYSVTVTDAGGNPTTRDNIEIVEPNLTVDIEIIEAFECFDDGEGTLSAVVFDGTIPISADSIASYDFAWNTGANTRIIADIPPGTYSVTATNRNTGCTSSASLNFRAPNRLLIENSSINSDAATCSGVSDGSVSINVSGGTRDGNGSYTIIWSDGDTTTSTDISRTDLMPGSYDVEVIDANGCTATSSFVIAAEKTIVLTADSTNISCFGDGDGTISVSARTEDAPADLPYRASLLDSAGNVVRAPVVLEGDGSTPHTFNDLEAGSYVIVLQDSDSEGCEVRRSITIVEPELLEITSANPTDVGCPNEAGTATIDVTGGTGPFTYRFVNDSLPNPADTLLTFDTTTVGNLNTLGELMADTNYVVIVTDANGCLDSLTFRIFSPPQVRIQPIVTDSVACPGDSDGQLTVLATPPPGDSITITGYTWYRINPDGSRGNVLEGVVGRTTEADLSVGFYEVEIALSNECNSSAFGEVASPGLVMLDSVNVNPPTCLGEATGSIFVFPTGGTTNPDGGYNYEWSTNPGSITNSNSIIGLAAGTYGVTITDANACQPAFETTFVLEDPVGIVGEFTITDVSCPSDTIMDGSATFTAMFSDDTAGTFDFFWSTGAIDSNATSSTVSDLNRGPISVTVTDGICPRIFTDTIGSPEDFAFTPTVTDASCNGVEDGTVSFAVTGGTPAYNFSYVDRPETTNTLDSVGAGIYRLVVTDANGCVADTASVAVGQPDALLLATDPTVTTPLVTCTDDEDGAIGVLVISTNNNPLGDDPYSWSDNVMDRDDSVARNLAPGTYSVTITDTRGCQDSLEYTIINPQPIVFALQDPEAPNCFGETTTIQLDTVFGGQGSSVGSYTYSIDEDGFLIPADQQGTAFAGELIITVFDSVGCSVSDTLTVDQPDEIVIDLADRVRIELGDTLTRLDPVITPATNSYTYLWSPPDFLSSDSVRSPFVFPLSDQQYTLTVTNQSGCVAIDDVLVTIDANRNIYLPNAFSPNQDGVNEEFRLFACLGVQSIDRVAIYNRWGGLISEAENMFPSCLDGTVLWNGANPKRKLVDPGVYVYTVEITFIDGVTLTYRGDITVVR